MRAIDRLLRNRPATKAGLSLAGKIKALFAIGEQGWWYDPSNFATLYQDSAGTTPVTAVEQPVGLQLDLSKGLVLGPTLLTNGDFSNGSTGWTLGASFSVSAGALQINSSVSDNAYQVVANTKSKWFVVEFTIVSITSGSVFPRACGVNGSPVNTARTVRQYVFSGTANDFIGIQCGAGTVATVDNISVKELPGNHRFQTTSANRPVVSARVNLLTNTGFTGTVAGTPGTAPTGWSFVLNTGQIVSLVGDAITLSATEQRHVLGQSIAYLAGSINRMTFVLGQNTGGVVARQLFVWNQAIPGANESFLANGTVQDASIYIPLPGDLLEYRLTVGATAGNSTIRLGIGCVGSTTGTVTISKPDLRVSNVGVNLPAYQRVNTSTDYDSTGFPTYIKPNGSNQFMVTNSINFSATDKMTVWQGVRKLSSGSFAMIAELSVSLSANNGTFALLGPNDVIPDYGFVSKGTAAAEAIANNYESPITNVLTSIGDISGDVTTLRVNGTQVGTSTANQGTGNYGTYPAYFYMRAGTSLPFNGHDYGSIARGAASTAAQITAGETWINQRTKAY